MMLRYFIYGCFFLSFWMNTIIHRISRACAINMRSMSSFHSFIGFAKFWVWHISHFMPNIAVISASANSIFFFSRTNSGFSRMIFIGLNTGCASCIHSSFAGSASSGNRFVNTFFMFGFSHMFGQFLTFSCFIPFMHMSFTAKSFSSFFSMSPTSLGI